MIPDVAWGGKSRRLGTVPRILEGRDVAAENSSVSNGLSVPHAHRQGVAF